MPTHRLYYQRRRDAIRDGTWQPRVPVETVAAHIATLHDSGMLYSRIAELAGVNEFTVRKITSRRVQHVQAYTANALLAVKPIGLTPPVGKVDSTATVRRIRALIAIGYTYRTIGERLGVEPATVHSLVRDGRRCVSADRAAAVAAMYDDWSEKPIPDAVRTRNTARRCGWVPPDAWSEDTIGDPDAAPYSWRDLADDTEPDEVAVGYVVSGFRRWKYLTRDVDRREVVRQLAAKGLAPGGIASRVNTSTGVIRRYLAGLPDARRRAA